MKNKNRLLETYILKLCSRSSQVPFSRLLSKRYYGVSCHGGLKAKEEKERKSISEDVVKSLVSYKKKIDFENLRIGIVGAGPSGFYTAKYLLKELEIFNGKDEDVESQISIDIIDKLPTPYGLVRSGVAPDHPEVKSVINDFENIAKDPRVHFYGNIEIGSPYTRTLVDRKQEGHIKVTNEKKSDRGNQKGIITYQDLLSIYDVVILTYGSSQDQPLNIPGEMQENIGNDGEATAKPSKGVLSAREFVNWYNGYPDLEPRVRETIHECLLSSVETCNFHKKDDQDINIIIIGQGNVAIDCARILTKSIEELASTDITEEAIEVLSKLHHPQKGETKQSKKKRNLKIHVIGRRGHVQAAFTIKEIRELTKLKEVHLTMEEEELEKGWTEASKQEYETQRPRKRLVDLLHKIAQENKERNASFEDMTDERFISFRYLLSPREIHLGETNKNGMRTIKRIKAVSFVRNQLVGDEVGKQRAIPIDNDDEIITIPCDLLLRSIGYKPVALPGLTLEGNKLLNDGLGRVCLKEETSIDRTKINKAPLLPIPRLYVAGWLKRGPNGIINSNIVDARNTVHAIIEDLSSVKESIASEETFESESTFQDSKPMELETESNKHNLLQYLKLKQYPVSRIVSWEGFERIDQEELRRGEEKGKLREKITSLEELYSVSTQ